MPSEIKSAHNHVMHPALEDDLTKLHAEIADLRSRVATLEAERVQAAAESIEPSF